MKCKMMIRKQKFVLCFLDAWFYSPGDYKVIFFVKSKETTIPFSFGVMIDGQKDYFEKINHTIEPINIPTVKTGPATLHGTELVVSFDPGNYVYPVYLHIEICRIDSPSFESVPSIESTGKILLQKKKHLLLEDLEEFPSKEECNGTLNLFEHLDNESVKVVSGWIKYKLSLSAIDDHIEENKTSDNNDNMVVENPVFVENGLKKNKVVLKEEDCNDNNDISNVFIEDVNQKEDNGINAINIIEEAINRTNSNNKTNITEDKAVDVIDDTKAVNILPLEPKVVIINTPINNQLKNKASTGYVLPSITEVSPVQSDFKINFPDPNAIKQLLPIYHSLQNPAIVRTIDSHVPIKEPDSQSTSTEKIADVLYSARPESLVLSPRTKENLDGHTLAVLDYQAKELDRYRNVIQRMGIDIMELRKEIVELKHSKSQLVSKLYYAGEGLEDDSNPKNDLVKLKRNLVAQVEEKNNLQDRVHNLQNELIKKNEMEVSYFQLHKAHTTQQKLVQECQEKLAKYNFLQNTVKTQEEVIEKFEQRIGQMNVNSCEKEDVSFRKNQDHKQSIKKTVSIKEPCKSCYRPSNQFESDTDGIDEKLTLIQKLQQAENKIIAMEEQLYNNTKEWVKERSFLQRSLTMVNPHQAYQRIQPYDDMIQTYPRQWTNR